MELKKEYSVAFNELMECKLSDDDQNIDISSDKINKVNAKISKLLDFIKECLMKYPCDRNSLVLLLNTGNDEIVTFLLEYFPVFDDYQILFKLNQIMNNSNQKQMIENAIRRWKNKIK
jgi:hypothetical protein